MKLILERQGVGDTVRTSTHCPSWGRDIFTEIFPCAAGHPEGQPWRAKVSGGFEGWFTTQLEARKQAAAFISRQLGEPAEFLPFTESYLAHAVKGDQHLAFCLYEPITASVRLHRSNVCLLYFKDDGLTTCGGTPTAFLDDGANTAYRPIVNEVIRCVLGQNCRGNDRIWVTWLISQYIHSNVLNRFPYNEPRFAGQPTFLHDLEPSLHDSLVTTHPQ